MVARVRPHSDHDDHDERTVAEMNVFVGTAPVSAFGFPCVSAAVEQCSGPGLLNCTLLRAL